MDAQERKYKISGVMKIQSLVAAQLHSPRVWIWLNEQQYT